MKTASAKVVELYALFAIIKRVFGGHNTDEALKRHGQTGEPALRAVQQSDFMCTLELL